MPSLTHVAQGHFSAFYCLSIILADNRKVKMAYLTLPRKMYLLGVKPKTKPFPEYLMPKIICKACPLLLCASRDVHPRLLSNFPISYLSIAERPIYMLQKVKNYPYYLHWGLWLFQKITSKPGVFLSMARAPYFSQGSHLVSSPREP